MKKNNNVAQATSKKNKNTPIAKEDPKPRKTAAPSVPKTKKINNAAQPKSKRTNFAPLPSLSQNTQLSDEPPPLVGRTANSKATVSVASPAVTTATASSPVTVLPSAAAPSETAPKKSQVLTPTPKATKRVTQLAYEGSAKRYLQSDETRQLGLMAVGLDHERLPSISITKQLDDFQTLYGSKPIVCVKVWNDLQDKRTIDCKANVKGYFIALHFLKRYNTEKEDAILFGVSHNTINKYRWFYVSRIRMLKEDKICWPLQWIKPDQKKVPILLLTVDGVHFKIQEPQHEIYSKNTSFYSHKFKTAGLNYEIGISLSESRVVHIRGPYRAALHDITVFREELLHKIPEGHFCIGDKGCLGESGKVMGPNSHDSVEVRQFKGRARARQESFNKRVKHFDCMDHTFIHGIDQHAECCDSVVIIVQHQMENGAPLFDI